MSDYIPRKVSPMLIDDKEMYSKHVEKTDADIKFETELKEEYAPPFQKHQTQYECLTCHEKMICVNDVVEETTRLDFLECPKCKSSAEVAYNPKGTPYITNFRWWR